MPAARLHPSRQPPSNTTISRLVSRLIHEGAEQLSDAELLALLFQSGASGASSIATASRLLDAHQGSLRSIASRVPPAPCPSPDPGRRSGAARQSALLQAALEYSRRSLLESMRERTVIGSPDELRRFLALWLRERPREVFAVLFLDSQNRLICAEEMFLGGIAQTSVYPREIARRALEIRACSVIVAHNHPSGVTEPSAADRRLTQALRSALNLLDVPVIDHFIVADNRCFSFAEAGLL